MERQNILSNAALSMHLNRTYQRTSVPQLLLSLDRHSHPVSTGSPSQIPSHQINTYHTKLAEDCTTRFKCTPNNVNIKNVTVLVPLEEPHP